MNTDIRISTSFLNHRKRKKLRQILGDRSDGYLIDLWINTAINRPKGILYAMDTDDIALDAGWEGRAGLFVDSLVEVGFLDFDGEWFKLHDWEVHQSYAVHAESRSDKARKAANKRWERINGINIKQQAQAEHTTSIKVGHATSNPPSPTPTPTPTPKPKEKKSTAKAESKGLPTKDELENGSPVLIKQTIKDMTEKLYNEKIFPKVHAFKNMMVKDGKNDSAILHVLSRCYLKGSTDKFDSKGPWGYCVAIMNVENGNYNERDHQKSV